jgi:hypothetical protein
MHRARSLAETFRREGRRKGHDQIEVIAISHIFITRHDRRGRGGCYYDDGGESLSTQKEQRAPPAARRPRWARHAPKYKDTYIPITNYSARRIQEPLRRSPSTAHMKGPKGSYLRPQKGIRHAPTYKDTYITIVNYLLEG